MGMSITPTRAPFYIKNPKGNPLFLRREDFSGFFPEPFPGAITPAALITATPATITITTAAITATVISNTSIKVKAFPFKETFQKVNLSTSL